MFNSIKNWINEKWRPRHPAIATAYMLTFTTLHGRLVLQHLIDNIYCQTYMGTDVVEMSVHNGRRSVIHEILMLIDQAENPDKYVVEVLPSDGAYHG